MATENNKILRTELSENVSECFVLRDYCIPHPMKLQKKKQQIYAFTIVLCTALYPRSKRRIEKKRIGF